MEPLILIAGMALLLVLVFFLGYPFFASRQQQQIRSASASSRQLQERKEQLYSSIKELDFDQQLGKLSAEDHARLRGQLESQALEVMQQLDALDGHSRSRDGADPLQERIEQAVRHRRTRPPAAAADRCPSCGADRRSGDLFCAQCGAPLGESEKPS